MRTTWPIFSRCTGLTSSTSTNIVFVRHGATPWNAQRRFQGHTDIPLSDEGRAQAGAIARALAATEFHSAVASDLSRAFETARIVAGDRVPIRPDARWREFAFGAWEGLTWEEIEERDPALRGSNSAAAKAYTPRGGESFEQVCARVADALAELRSLPGTHLVVTHAGALHAMLHVLFEGRENESGESLGVRFLPASVTRVRIAGGASFLERLNDVAHLDSTV